MGNFFGNLYCLLQSLFGKNLADCLWGFDCTTQDYTGTNLFGQIGLITIGIVFILTMVYYYILNPVNYNRWYHWICYGILTSIISLIIGIVQVPSLEQIQPCLLLSNNGTSQYIFESDRFGFGMANSIISFIEFFLFSVIVKWKSSNAKNTPF